MATKSRTTDDSLAKTAPPGHAQLQQKMHAEPYRFRFFQAMRLLEAMHPERRPVGGFSPPAEEVARFSARPTLTFPASEVQDLRSGEGQPTTLEVNFLGLNTVNGPMPRANTALLLERQRGRDGATAEFHDIFNHRMISLFYRAWKRYRFFLAAESTRDEGDAVADRLYDLVGLGSPGLRGRQAIPDEATIFYAGLLSRQVRSADGLEQILAAYFGVRVEVRQFTGTWERLSPDQQTHLREGSTFAESLGRGTIVGDEVWIQEAALTVRLGPMRLERYQQFLPGGEGQRELESWLHFYSRKAFSFVVQLVLEREEVPRVELAQKKEERKRLGYESWLKVKPLERDPDETTYVLQ